MNILKITDQSYPYLLRQIYDPPQKLFYKGNLKILSNTCIGIVGTRKFSDYGEEMTERIIEELSVLNIAIVSGLAKGIDTIAHKSAIKFNIPTIAVLGSGLENIYPPENKKLFYEIEKNGLVLSEYEPQEEPVDFHFPQRNRIISGLSIAIIVIECPIKSGALITAKLALEQNREVFVVPGDIDRENSLGSLKLLQKGEAYPISSGKDVIEILKIQPHLFSYNSNPHQSIPKQPNKKMQDNIYNLTEEERKILKVIPCHRGISLDEIKKKTEIPTSMILSIISILEIKELIKTNDGKFSILKH